MDLIDELLSKLGLEKYLPLFKDNDIDADLLLELSLDDLKEIGITSLGHRKKLLAVFNPDATSSRPPEQQQEAEAKRTAVVERREVTTVFADLTGYTRLSRELETEDLHAVLSVFYSQLDELVERLGGTVERHIGDCVMAVFGAPVSYGNDAEHALRASMEMHRAMVDMSVQLKRELSIHIGVASGNVIFSSEGQGSFKELGFTLTGDSVNLASRLADKAEGGQTLITGRVASALANQIEIGAPGALEVKGFDEVVVVHTFNGFNRHASEYPVIGRLEELAVFKAALSNCATSGKGELIALVAEAGLGKSCLVDEFERIAALEGFDTHKSHILDFGLSDALDPIRGVLRSICGIEKQEPALIAKKLAQLADEGVLDEQSMMFLTVLLGASLDSVSQQVYEVMNDIVRFEGKRRAIEQVLQSVSKKKTIVIVVEDLHWADQEILEELAHIANATRMARAILIVTFRPESDPLTDEWQILTAGASLRRLQLKPLQNADAMQMARRLISPPSDEVLRACISRAEGNPLFLDQLLRHARDDESTTVPGSIQSIVQSKLDRLNLLDRVVLESAAVLGQHFSLEQAKTLAQIDNWDETPLVDASLIRAIQQGYLFAHALIRDAVLRTILRDDLHGLHRHAAEFFKENDAILYAEHLAAAQDEDAAEAFLVAARQAHSSHRKESALALAERGLAVTENPAANIGLLQLKGEMLRDFGRGAEAVAAFEAVLEVAISPVQRCGAQIGIAATMRILDRIDDAFRVLDDAEALAETSNLTHELSEIHYYRGSLHFPLGNLDDCLAEHNKSLVYAKKSNLPERQALALSGLGDAHYARGTMFTAHKVIEECLQLCDEHQLVSVESANRFMLATVKIYMNQTTLALKEAKASSELAAKVGHARAEIVARLTTGWILASMAELPAAETEINKGLELAGNLGAKRFEPFLEETLAEIALTAGDKEKAEKISEAALDKLRDLNAMSFIGPWVLSTAARATSDLNRMHVLLNEGEQLLAQGCVGHNYYRFYKNAMEACIESDELKEACRYADLLGAYTQNEPTPWSDFFIARTRAIVDARNGEGSKETLNSIRKDAEEASLHASIRGLEIALTIC